MCYPARVFFLASVAIALWSSDVDPCSCVSSASPHPLLQSGVTVPADARGIPWAGARDVKRWEVSVKRLDRRSPPVPFSIETVEYPMGYSLLSNNYSSQGMDLICPEWVAGGTYRVTVAGGSIDVIVSEQRFEPSDCGLDVWHDESGEVTTMTLGGSCSVTFLARQLGVEMTGPLVDRWGGALVYFTVVDDELAWRPRRSLCKRVLPGESWVGPMRELLYCGCPDDDSGAARGATYILSAGEHKVTMIGWLPGVTRITATTTISLACE